MKKSILVLILSVIAIFAFGQRKTLPDTLINTDYFDVVRIKDTVYSISKRRSRKESLDEITFSNGVKIYNNSGFLPAISENEKMIAVLYSSEKQHLERDFSDAIIDV